MSHHVIMIIGRGNDDVNLAGVVGCVAQVGSFHALVFLHQLPPELVEVLIGICVKLLLETQHHLAPAGEDKQLVSQHF